MSAAEPAWDVEIRPHRVKYFVYIGAISIAAIHIAVSFLLTVGSSGVVFRVQDQIAIIGIGLILAAAVMLLGRPRLRVGPAGMSVRNVAGDRLVPWTQVQAVVFPANARWARIELPHDEYVPLMAIQAIDDDRAVDAMDTVRDLVARYRRDPDAPSAD
ncbi:hypothetical protein BHQ15_07545 [Mycolicibacillus koreensis]|nr:hypothetical protein BHQ15_07545 [Mycolicibacillus koreensis]